MRLLPTPWTWLTLLPLLVCASLAGLAAATDAGREQPRTAVSCLLFVGTYTGAKSEGIYAFRMDLKTGALSPLGLAAATPNPTFLALDPQGGHLYAANEINNFQGRRTGAVSAFSIDSATGKLTLVNQAASEGAGPCHLIVDRAGKHVLVANYLGGSIAVLPLETGGRLGAPTAAIQHHGSSVNRQRQAGPHAHCIELDATNRFALVCDLGLDQVLAYRFAPSNGTLTPNDPPSAPLRPGAGPRHLAFAPGGRHAYVINEMGSTITVFAYDPQRGELKEIQTVSTLPDGFQGQNSTAEIEVHSSGTFLYGSNRGHDSIAVFKIETGTGKLTPVQHISTQGKVPRNFALDPTGSWLLAANQNTDNIAVFKIDQSDGRLTPTGTVLEVGAPVCLKFLRPR